MALSAFIRSLLVNEPFGSNLFPPRSAPTKKAIVDGRTAGLRVLARYISELTFLREGDAGRPVVPFVVKEDDIHIEWPDQEEDLVYPSMAFVQVEDGEYQPIGLTALILEETRDKFGNGTVLQQQSQYVETLSLECHASLKPERRAMRIGLEEALVPTEQMYGIRFRMPAYYDQIVTFSLGAIRLDDSPDAARHRRVARLSLEMTYNVVALVNYAELRPMVNVNTDVDEATGVEVVIDPNKLNNVMNPP